MSTNFTKEDVWKKVKQIPLGCFSTYQKVAEALGSPQGQQGVAKSLRVHDCELDSSKLTVICSNDVHCYRVINSDYSVGGYVFDDKGEQIEAKVNMFMSEISHLNITVDKRTLRKRKSYLGTRAGKNQLKNNFAMESE